MDVLERYFDAIRRHDWQQLAECLAEDVERTGPYLDVVRGRQAYVAFLSGLVPALRGYRLDVSGVRRLADGSALVQLRERVEVDGVAIEFPEAILFDFDAGGRIGRVAVYLQDPRGPRSR